MNYLRRHLHLGFLLGAGTGGLLALLETACLRAAWSGLGERLHAWLAIVVILTLVLAIGGALAVLAIAPLSFAADRLAARLRWSSPLTMRALLLALPLLPGTYLLAGKLFSGHGIAAMVDVRVAIPLATAALALALFALVYGLVRLGRLLASDRLRPDLAAFATLWALATGSALFVADAFLYRRLYGYLHGVLAGLTVAALVVAVAATDRLFALLWRRRRPTPRRASDSRPAPQPPLAKREGAARLRRRLLAAAAAAACCAMAALAAVGLARRQGVRFPVLSQTVVVSKLAALIAARPSELSPRPDTASAGHDGSTSHRASSGGAGSGGSAPHGAASRRPPLRRTVRLHDRRETASLPVYPDANLVLITIDALRSDRLSHTAYGRPLTPALDALAERGVRFLRAYAQAPHTSYSISSLMSSDYLRSTTRLKQRLPPSLAEVLAKQGYKTLAFFTSGIFFTEKDRLGDYQKRNFGFAEVDHTDRTANAMTNTLLDKLQALRRQGEPKFFLWAHYFDVHEPYRRRPDIDFGGSLVARYDAAVAYSDREVGRLLAGLSQLDRPTVIVVTADHGEEFREHGGLYHGSALYEEQIRVPLILVAPELPPRLVSAPVELVDVAPTLLGLLGLEPPASMRGDDLCDFLVGDESAARSVFAEVDTLKMVVRGNWKLIHDTARAVFELYDLAADPGERVNTYDRYPALAAELQNQLHAWFDSLYEAAPDDEQVRPAAIALGRLGDQRAVPLLAELLAARGQEPDFRAEAARLLGLLGLLGGRPISVPALLRAVGDDDSRVAAEAAIALGTLYDRRARGPLAAAVIHDHDANLRHRGAIALARLGDRRAVPVLIEGLRSDDPDIRRLSIHFAGQLRDARALPALFTAALELTTRYLVAVAVGRIGGATSDPRALPFLRELLARETYSDIRGYIVIALGYLGDATAIPLLLPLLSREPENKYVPETLTRLGAIRRGALAGIDFGPERIGLERGFADCRRVLAESTSNYLGSTTCLATQPGARMRVALGSLPVDAAPMRLLLRLRPLHPDLAGAPLTMVIDGRPLPPLTMAAGWQELSLQLPSGSLGPGGGEIVLDFAPAGEAAAAGGGGPGLIELDYLLLVLGKYPPATGGEKG